MKQASLEVSLEPGRARDLGDGKLLTDQGYEVEVERAMVRVERMELQEARGGASGEEFDPANPPPGYSLCHSGHCHRDGELVAYEEVEVELAGGVEAFAPLMTLKFDAEISMLGQQQVSADAYAPSKELPQGSPRRVLVILSRIEIQGAVTGDELGDAALPLSVDLPIRTEFHANLQPTEIDRNSPDTVTLKTRISVDGTLFDAIDFAALDAEGRIVIDNPDAPAALQLETSFADSETTASLH